MVLLTRGDVIKGRITSRNKIVATILSGLIFLIVPILVILLDPITMIVNYKLGLSKGTLLYELLQHEIVGPRLSMYIFNITNSERFLSGEDYKLKVEEVGPFVFQEYRWYEDLEVSEDGKQMAMTPKVRSEFVPEASLAHPKDVYLTLPNLPLLSSLSLLSNYPSFVRFPFNMMAAQLGSKAIMNLDVHNYLWGYKNPLITIFNGLAPGLVYFDKIGLLDRLYDNESDFRIVVDATDEDRFKIKSVKKFTHLQMGTIKDVEESEETFTDTYEGLGYPTMLTPDVPINLYRLGICKTFNMEYIGSKTMDYGGEVFVYTFSNQTFTSDLNPITAKAYPDGLLDISRCYYGLPFVVSKPHFLDADPKLLERVEGLKPDRNVHLNEFFIDRKASVTFDTKMSLQLSMILDDISFNSQAKMLSNIVLPIVHVKFDLPKMPINRMFVVVYKIGPYVLMFLEIMLFFIGLVILAQAARSLYHNWLSTSKRMVFNTTLDEKFVKARLPLIKE